MRKPHILRHIWMVGLLCAGISTVSARAAADAADANSAAAQALFDQGRQLMAQGNLADACSKFEESARIVGHSGTLLNLADCYEKQGRIATAWSAFLNAAAAANRGGNGEREAEARSRADALAPSLPKIVINVAIADKNAGITVTRDGTIVGQAQFGMPIPADPGAHKFTASMPGAKPWETTIDVKKTGETVQVDVPPLEAQSVAVRTTPAESPQSHPVERPARAGWDSRRTTALVIGGVGVAGVAAGSIFGLMSKSDHDKADQHCTGSECRDSEGVSLRSDARHWGNGSTVAFIVGAAGLATGTALWLTTPTTESPLPAQVGVGVGSIFVRGMW
jgi:hypothetical protein